MSQQFKPSPLVTTTEPDFTPWPKIARGQHEWITITEKMDGTNICIIIKDGLITGIQSRKRFITPGKESDNFGFAAWVHENAETIVQLGDGRHYGEWCGGKIQNNPHALAEKTLYLFDVLRWNDKHMPPAPIRVVPRLYSGDYTPTIIDATMQQLLDTATADQNPEGVIVFFKKGNRLEKHTFNYQKGKWAGK
jgi:hypothetical protein